MTKPRNYQTEAIIIKKTRLGEADRILTLYTPYLGKIQAVAKGVRRPRSKMSGHLELLTYSQVSLARGRNLDTVTGAQTINSFMTLKSDLELTAQALYVTELINQFTVDHIENYSLFRILSETLESLGRTSNKAFILPYFELHLLNKVGYRPQLRECVACHRSLEPTTNYFSPGAGGMLCPDCRRSQPFTYTVPVNVLKVLRFLQDSDFNTASRLKLDTELSRQLATVMRGNIRYLLEREVKSTAWLDSLQEQMKGDI